MSCRFEQLHSTEQETRAYLSTMLERIFLVRSLLKQTGLWLEKHLLVKAIGLSVGASGGGDQVV